MKNNEKNGMRENINKNYAYIASGNQFTKWLFINT